MKTNDEKVLVHIPGRRRSRSFDAGVCVSVKW